MVACDFCVCAVVVCGVLFAVVAVECDAASSTVWRALYVCACVAVLLRFCVAVRHVLR